MDKSSKSIAEYAIRRWLVNQGFAMDNFTLAMDRNKGTLEDRNGDHLILVYDGKTRSVYAEDV